MKDMCVDLQGGGAWSDHEFAVTSGSLTCLAPPTLISPQLPAACSPWDQSASADCPVPTLSMHLPSQRSPQSPCHGNSHFTVTLWKNNANRVPIT